MLLKGEWMSFMSVIQSKLVRCLLNSRFWEVGNISHYWNGPPLTRNTIWWPDEMCEERLLPFDAGPVVRLKVKLLPLQCPCCHCFQACGHCGAVSRAGRNNDGRVSGSSPDSDCPSVFGQVPLPYVAPIGPGSTLAWQVWQPLPIGMFTRGLSRDFGLYAKTRPWSCASHRIMTIGLKWFRFHAF